MSSVNFWSLGPGCGVPRFASDTPIAAISSLIEVEGVSKRVGGLRALDDVSLIARTGEVTAVIGPNGADTDRSPSQEMWALIQRNPLVKQRALAHDAGISPGEPLRRTHGGI